jgi:molecular chaperone DnaK
LLRDGSELAKIRLSSIDATRVQIPQVGQDEDGTWLDIDIELTREQLERLTMDLVDRTIATCERIFEEAGTNRNEVDEMLLVGGQSRMPLVRRKVQDFIGKEPSQKVHPDEAVAIGASIMAYSLAAKGGSADVTLLDVLPSAIGINKVDGTMHVLFAKNQPLPDYKTRVLTTSKDNQRSIMLKIYQGESKFVNENELLGTFVFSGLREATKGSVKVEVTFHIDSEGILNLTARDQSTGQLVESRLKLGKDDEDRRAAVPLAGASSGTPPKKVVKKKKDDTPPPPVVPLLMPTSQLGAKPFTEATPEPAPAVVPEPPKQLPAAPEGLIARILAFFRGLFGGGQ